MRVLCYAGLTTHLPAQRWRRMFQKYYACHRPVPCALTASDIAAIMFRLAHAQVIIGTPDDHLARAFIHMPQRVRVPARSAVPALQNDGNGFPALTGQPCPAIGSGNPTDPPMLPAAVPEQPRVHCAGPALIIRSLPMANNRKTCGATIGLILNAAPGFNFGPQASVSVLRLTWRLKISSSGILPNGSRAGLVSWLAGASVNRTAPKIIPFGNLGSTRAASSIRPRRVPTDLLSG